MWSGRFLVTLSLRRSSQRKRGAGSWPVQTSFPQPPSQGMHPLSSPSLSVFLAHFLYRDKLFWFDTPCHYCCLCGTWMITSSEYHSIFGSFQSLDHRFGPCGCTLESPGLR